jgi:glutaredoxin
MANKIIVFTLDGCGHCTQLKEKMRENSIPFTEIPIQENKKIWDQVVNQTGDNALPTVFISMDDNEEGPVFVAGRDFTDKDIFIETLKTYV